MAYLSPIYLRGYDVTNFLNSRYLTEARTASVKPVSFFLTRLPMMSMLTV